MSDSLTNPSWTPGQPNGHAEVVRRAHALWLLEGRPTGRSLEHWLMAEALIRAERHQRYGRPRTVPSPPIPPELNDSPSEAEPQLTSDAMQFNPLTGPRSVDLPDAPPEWTCLTTRPLRVSDLPVLRRLLPAHASASAQAGVEAPTAAGLRRLARQTGGRDGAWVAEIGDGVLAGFLALQHDDRDAGRLRHLWVDPDWRDTPVTASLIEAALDCCWLQYTLKVVLEPGLNRDGDTDRHHPIFRGCGYHFAGQRRRDGRDVQEFYCDLYTAPDQRDTASQ